MHRTLAKILRYAHDNIPRTAICWLFPLLSTQLTRAEPLQIGVIQSLSGIAQEDGTTVLNAVQLAAKKLNKETPDSVALLVEDDQCQPKNTVSAYQKLKAAGVKAIIGSTWTFTTNAIAPLADRDRIPILNTSTLPEALNYAEANGYLFSNSLPVDEEVKPFENFLATHKFKLAAILHNNSAWGMTLNRKFQRIAANANIKVVEEYATPLPENNNWQEVIPRLKSKGADLVVLLLGKNDIDLVLRKTNEMGLKATFFASKNTLDALSQTQRKALYEGVCYSYPLEELTANSEFVRAYQAEYKTPPKIYADNSYDAVFILYQAWRQANEKKIELRHVLQTAEFQGLAAKYKYTPDSSLSRGHSSLVCVKHEISEIVDGY